MQKICELKFIGKAFQGICVSDFGLDDGKYLVDIKPLESVRTLRQNAYMWALINEIAKKEDGNIKDSFDIYLKCLKMAGAKSDIIIIKQEAYPSFRDKWRDCQILTSQDDSFIVQVFYGSSKMNKKEMGELIDVVIRYASELGIETDYWEEILKG